MPQTPRPKSTTLYLPNPDSSSEPTSSTSTKPPSLDVLLVAQQIAHSRGHAFDIESFLAPSQRDEYLAYLASGEPSEYSKSSISASASEGAGPGASETESPSAGAYESDSADEPPNKRARLAPSLSQMYWRQRLDRLGLPRAASAPVTPRATPRELKTEPDSPASTPAPHHKKKPLTPIDKAEIRRSASYWNNLLTQARASRVPAWDYNTQSLQFSRQSPEYYTQGRPVPPSPPKPTKALAGATPASDTDPSLTNGSLKPKPATTPARAPMPLPRPGPGPGPQPHTYASGPPGPAYSPQQQQTQLRQAQVQAQAQAQAQAAALGQNQFHPHPGMGQMPPGMARPGMQPGMGPGPGAQGYPGGPMIAGGWDRFQQQ